MAVITAAGSYYPDYLALRSGSPLILKTDRKVIVHLDVNQTLILEDNIQGKSNSDVVQHGLAKACRAVWDSTISDRSMTYHDFVFDHQIVGPRSDKILKKKRVSLVTQFVPYLAKTPSSPLHVYAPQAKATHETALRLLGSMAESGRKIVPSFYDLVTRLNDASIEYKIILRSFGNDTEDARDEIERETGIEFFRPTLQFLGEHLIPGEGVPNFDEQGAFYQFCQDHHTCVRDDWKWWNSHEEIAAYGKKFPLDPDDANVHSIFFDDNINSPVSATNIVAPFDANSGKALDLEPLFARHILVPVEPLAPLFNPHYFANELALSLAEADGVVYI